MSTRRRWLPVTGLVVAVVAIVALFLFWRVCDEQLASTGQVVTVCRHMTITDPPIVACGLAVLVLLSYFYAEISGFGFTLRRKVAELDERSEALQESVGDLAEFNREHAQPRLADAGPGVAGAVPDPRIASLVNRYNTLRWTMPSSQARTRRMTEVFDQLTEALRDAPGFDLDGHLDHRDRGVRLAAYAYLMTHSDVPGALSALVDAAATEDKPFGQYRALRAALYQRDVGGSLGREDRRALRALRDRVGSDTDRGRLVTLLLDER